MHERLTELEDKQMDIMIRLNNLSMATGSLRNKTGKNREMAKEAKSQANNATMQASSLEQASVRVAFELFFVKMLRFQNRKENMFFCSSTIM